MSAIKWRNVKKTIKGKAAMNKKFNYIVTDPCYLMPHEIWAEVCDKTKGKPNKEFADELVKHLPKGAMVQTTGIGDDINSIYPVWEEDTVNIVQPAFTSDSGFVCIVPVKSIKNCVDDVRFAIIVSDDELAYGFDTTSCNKTVVEFAHNGKEVAQSEFVE